jgi:peptide/nickel transport system permease protein
MNKRRWQNLKRELARNKFGLAAILILAVLTLASLFAFLSPYDPNKMEIQDRLQAPSWSHLFMIIATALGTTVGTISGYFGGKLDNFLMRIVDILMSIPSFFLLLILNAYLKPGVQNLILIIGLMTWMDIARIVRAETLSVKEREYVLYARVSGQSPFFIITKHIIPNISSTIIVAATLNIASAILLESSLSFLGLGVQQPNSSWGSMLNNAQGYIGDAWHLALFPGFLILLTVLSFNVLGDILRVAFEPKVNDR